MRKTRTAGWGSTLFAVSALTALVAAGPAQALQFPAIYAFGDSLSDAGNIWTFTSHAEPVSPPYSAGRFSNGPVWVQDLSGALGLGTLKASLLGGTDFAAGGATTGQSSVHNVTEADLPTQLIEFGADVPKPKASALYTLWIGANDLLAILSSNLSASATQAALAEILANEENFLAGLVKLGATHFLVLTVPDLGVTPDISGQGAAAAKAATALTKRFNAQLTATLKAKAAERKLDLTIVDTLTLIDAAIANPAKYGFTNVSAPCWTGNFSSASGKVCASSVTVQDKHLFWDMLHPTAAGHAQIADAVEAALKPTAAMVLATASR